MKKAGSRYRFGTLQDGSAVEAVVIGDGDLSAVCLTWGAVVQDLRHTARPWPLVLGLNRLEDYVASTGFLGATAGRFANRIAGARFTLDGVTYQLDANSPGGHHLHGGTVTFGRRNWNLVDCDRTSVTFSLHSPDGEGGYPGNLDVTCRYEIRPPSTLHVAYGGQTDAPTLLNIAHHSYFNLAGGGSVRDHLLRVDADHYLPVDNELIPTGEIASVEGTEYDFRHIRTIGVWRGRSAGLYDINMCLAPEPAAEARAVAELRSADGSVVMTVATTEPGLQVYDGAKLAIAMPGLEGKSYGAHSGICLEAQRWPDSPNHPAFAGAVLRPGEGYRQVTEYRFSVAA